MPPEEVIERVRELFLNEVRGVGQDTLGEVLTSELMRRVINDEIEPSAAALKQRLQDMGLTPEAAAATFREYQQAVRSAGKK